MKRVILHCDISVSMTVFKAFYLGEYFRLMGVRVGNLITKEYNQILLFDVDTCKICVNIDERVRIIISKLGELNVEKSATSKEWD